MSNQHNAEQILPELLLASRSPAREQMLKRCGLQFSVVAADLDEESFLDAFRQNTIAPQPQDFKCAARELAEMKARKVAMLRENSSGEDFYVIGGDQMLVCDSVLYGKSRTQEELRRNLKAFRSKEHHLFSAAAVVFRGAIVWSHCAVASLLLRNFSDAFLDTYIEKFGEQILSSVGGYRIEEEGALLFANLKVDPYVVQGLPLLQLLGFLREQDLKQPLLLP